MAESGTVLEFKADLQKLSEALDITLVQAVKWSALAIHNGVILKTPVDTGRARGSWGISLDEVGTFELPEGEYGADGGAALAKSEQRNLAAYSEENPFREIWVFNNLPYVEALENGHSQQAPQGMVVITLAEVEAEVDAQLEALAQQNLK